MNKNENTMIRFNIRLSKEMHDYYKEKSERTGVSMSSLIFLDLEEVQERKRRMNY